MSAARGHPQSGNPQSRRALFTVAALVLLGIGVLAPIPAAQATPGPGNSVVEVATHPAYPDYPITIGRVTRKTDATGVARFTLPKRLVLKDTDIKVAPRYYVIGGVRQRVEPAQIQAGRRKRILFNVYYPMRFDFVGTTDAVIDTSVIRTISLRSSVGLTVDVPAHEITWLQGSRVVPLGGRMAVKKLQWTVQDVRYSGSSVVNASQQRFSPAERQAVRIRLLFFSARLKVHDAILGLHPRGELDLIFPDQSRRTMELTSGGVYFASLPRGSYTAVIRASGPRLVQPVAITTNQDLDLRYFTWYDVGIVALAGIGTVFGLLWIGLARRGLTPGRRRRSAAATEARP